MPAGETGMGVGIQSFRRILFSIGLAFAPGSATDRPVAGLAEFNQAITEAKPGDAIVLKNGGYKDLVFTCKGLGAEGNPIRFRAETPGAVTFTGKTQIFIDGDYLEVSGFKFEGIAGVPTVTTAYGVEVGAVVTFTEAAHYSRLTETAIANSGTGVTGYFHMDPGGQFNRVDHCYFSGQKGIGPSLYIEADKDKPNFATLEACFIGNRAPGNGNKWETIRIGHSEQQYFASKATVMGNYFTKCDGENEMISNKSSGNKYLYNTLVDNRGELTLRHGEEAWVEGNFMEKSAGIRVIGSKHVIINNYLKQNDFGFNVYAGETNPEPAGYTQVIDAVIAFNTLENCGTEFMFGSSGRPAPPKNLRVGYNLVQSGGGNILNYDNAASDVKFEGNIMYGGAASKPGIINEKPALAADQWNRLVADASKLPVQVNPASFPQVVKDLDGTVRSGTSDVGAIQSPNVHPLYPLDPKEVGPLWMGRVPTPVRGGAAGPDRAVILIAPGFVPGTLEILLPFFRGRPIPVEVHDAGGRLVRRLWAKEDRIAWDGRDQEGGVSPRGTYLLSVIAEGMTVSRSVRLR
jgi:poly(beta-D-mannuronate) lyase